MIDGKPRPEGSRLFAFTLVLLELLALVIGLPLALIATMALLGAVIVHSWLLLAGAALLVLLPPLLIADRLLPASDPAQDEAPVRGQGIVRQVLAVSWLGLALISVAASGSPMGGLLHAQTDRFTELGWERAAWACEWMAGSRELEPAASVDEPVLASAEPATTPTAPVPTPSSTLDPAFDPAPPPEPALEPALDPNAPADPAVVVADPPAEAAVFTPAEVFATYAPSVVAIMISRTDHEAGGTGFLVDELGTIVTNHHVINRADRVSVKLIDGTIIDQVELLTSDPVVDLALLRVDPSKLTGKPKPIVLGDSASVTVGEPVMVIGNPLGLEHTLSDGLVSSRRIYEGKKYIQMSAPISPGNSGGPVFDRHAKVVGVSVAGFPWGENLNLAVPIAELSAMLKSDYPDRRRFGSSSW